MTNHSQLNASLHLNDLRSIPNINVTAPSSKSETNRALLLSAMCPGHTELKDVLVSQDTHYMTEALRALGVAISSLESDTVNIYSLARFIPPPHPIFIGNSGTTARFFTALSCLVDGEVCIDGDDDMRQRPMMPLIQSLQRIGFNIESTEGSVPIRYASSKNKLNYSISVDAQQSTQFTSALMMIAPMLPEGLTISLSDNRVIDGSGYYDVTTQIMSDFGAEVTSSDYGLWHIAPTGYISPKSYQINADYSACTYLWAAEKLRCASVCITNDRHRDTKQPDAKAHKWISMFPSMPSQIDGRTIQDAIPTLAVLAALNNHQVSFTGIKNLRVKECDRIEALYAGLNQIHDGLAVIDGDDLIVKGNPQLKPKRCVTRISTYNDHRIAMSFALLAYRIGGLVIENPHCVNKTFPRYWETLEKLGVSSQISF